jgi:hypothetical protein
MARIAQGPASRKALDVREVPFSVGHHRPVYFWGGPATVRMNRLKFMDAPVNEAVHLEAHTAKAARLLAQAGFNWAYLMHNSLSISLDVYAVLLCATN